jgi:hypothetical protein
MTAATGMDALTHAVESYVAPWCDESSAKYSESAVKKIMAFLPRCVEKTRGEGLIHGETFHLWTSIAHDLHFAPLPPPSASAVLKMALMPRPEQNCSLQHMMLELPSLLPA